MRYTEKQIRKEIVRELRTTSDGRLTISELISRLSARLSPEGRDKDILKDRSDSYFSQKVRNTVSHRGQDTSLEQQQVASYSSAGESWNLTPYGWSADLKDLR